MLLILLALALPAAALPKTPDPYPERFVTSHVVILDLVAQSSTIEESRIVWTFSDSEIAVRGGVQMDIPVATVAEPGRSVGRHRMYLIASPRYTDPIALYSLDERGTRAVIGYCSRETDARGWYGSCSEVIYFTTFRPSAASEVIAFGNENNRPEASGRRSGAGAEPNRSSQVPPASEESEQTGTEWIYFGGRRLRAGVSAPLFMYSGGPTFGSTQESRYIVRASLFEDGEMVRISFTDPNTYSSTGPLMNRGEARLFLSDGSTIPLTDRGVRGVFSQEGGSSYRYSVYQLTASEVSRLRRLGVSSVEFPMTASRRLYRVEAGWSNGLRDQVRALGR